ncbi:hypothetical protein BRYFOR_07270 [Marvinbryantia formatexigens DSM 14469]|uniref:Uncharacterized protein n=1 Tax=Marvinbryantia formatexigens DSM 14469 TaxID=478749 RepID=C6LF68_9FIRM|nr:hypothetical protein BRYFOR_07270 [Marvinbryantia formatexigens DSM 14469]
MIFAEQEKEYVAHTGHSTLKKLPDKIPGSPDFTHYTLFAT